MELLGSQFHNCSGLSISELRQINYINIITSIVCLIVLLLLLAFLVLYKAFKTTLQRLLLHLVIATTLNTTVNVLNIELQYDLDERFCMGIGFADTWSSNLIELFNFSLTAYLMVLTYKRLDGRKVSCCFKCCKGSTIKELVCVCIIYILPLCYLWVPFYHHTYGMSDTVCWIRSTDNDCNPINNSRIDFFTLEATNFFLSVVVIISFTVLILTFLSLIMQYHRTREHGFKTLCKMLVLTLVLSVSTLMKISQMVVNVITDFFKVKVNVYWYNAIDNSAQIISSLLVPLGFTIYLYSLKKLRIRSIKKAAVKWCTCCPRHVKSKERAKKIVFKNECIIEDGESTTINSSIENETPSYTMPPQSSPYTNEFTDITEVISSFECKKNSKYGSVDYY